jgi:hypothetical protein
MSESELRKLAAERLKRMSSDELKAAERVNAFEPQGITKSMSRPRRRAALRVVPTLQRPA